MRPRRSSADRRKAPSADRSRLVRRKCAACGGGDGVGFDDRCDGCRAFAPPRLDPESLGAGRPFDGPPRARMEQALGADLRGVRLHDDEHAAKASSDLDARAFTVGNHVAFSSGAYRPGTLAGDALLAHELAHVVQQRGSEDRPGAEVDTRREVAAEADADHAAVGALRHLHGAQPAPRSSIRQLSSGPRLQRCGSTRMPDRNPKDMRAGTSLPDSATRDEVRGKLGFPKVVAGTTTAPTVAGEAPPEVVMDWDGVANDTRTEADAATNRAALEAGIVTSLHKAILDLTKSFDTGATVTLGAGFAEGPCRAAKAAVDAHFNAWITNRAVTPDQKAAQQAPRTAGTNLFDAGDIKAREAAGVPIHLAVLAAQLSESASKSAFDAHKFDFRRSDAEGAFFIEVINRFMVDPERQRRLALLDTAGSSLAAGPNIFLSTVVGGASPARTSAGALTPDGRFFKWHMFKTCVHEYIHTLAHPAFAQATLSKAVPLEGFTEMFTKEVLTDVLPRAAGDKELRIDVEGGDYGAGDPDLVRTYRAIAGSYKTPDPYVIPLAKAEEIRVRLGSGAAVGGGWCSRPHVPPGGYNAVKAAYFQGHVELLGLEPDGKPGPIGGPDIVSVPAEVPTVEDLARVSRVPLKHILTDNGLTAGAALTAGKPIKARGAREHVVASAKDAKTTVAETREQIAAIHGIAPALLEAANPAITREGRWGSLKAGDRILIPKR